MKYAWNIYVRCSYMIYRVETRHTVLPTLSVDWTYMVIPDLP